MPKFWSRGLQFIGEKLGREVTEDKDFENLLTKVDKTEKGFIAFRSVIQNFNSYFEKFTKFFSDISEALNLIYSDTPYYAFIEEFVVKQQLLSVHIEDMNKLLVKLYSRSSEWDKIFEDGKKKLVERENKRKEYDHYENKLLKIKDSKDKKYIERNEEKYTKAASEYVEISEKIFNQLEGALKLGWELANPVVSDLIVGEQKMLEGMSNTLSCFKDNVKRFTEIGKSISNPDTKMKKFNYDPVKYIKGKDLIRRVSVNRTIPFSLPSNLNDGKNIKLRSATFSEMPKSDLKKINFYNILMHSRLTNSFGEIQEDKLKEFLEFEDDFE
jgi:hypothetical protein